MEVEINLVWGMFEFIMFGILTFMIFLGIMMTFHMIETHILRWRNG